MTNKILTCRANVSCVSNIFEVMLGIIFVLFTLAITVNTSSFTLTGPARSVGVVSSSTDADSTRYIACTYY